MAKGRPASVISADRIEQSILFIRGHKVLLDADLAHLYGVEIKALNRAVKRNLDRFPEDFMFQLTRDEWTALRSQIGTIDLRCQFGTSNSPPGDGTSASKALLSNQDRRGGRRYLPYVFTEQGVAMLSSVLRSKQAVIVNIEIMRAFVRLRQVLAVNAELAHRLDEVEKHLGQHDEQFVDVIRAIRQLMDPPAGPTRRRIGFHTRDDVADVTPTGRTTSAKRRQHNRLKRSMQSNGGDQ
jgi:hypothetical protein